MATRKKTPAKKKTKKKVAKKATKKRTARRITVMEAAVSLDEKMGRAKVVKLPWWKKLFGGFFR